MFKQVIIFKRFFTEIEEKHSKILLELYVCENLLNFLDIV